MHQPWNWNRAVGGRVGWPIGVGDVVAVLRDLARLEAYVDPANPHRPRAFTQAARSIEAAPEILDDLSPSALQFTGIGASTLAVLEDLRATGRSARLDALVAAHPLAARLMQVRGIGPKLARRLIAGEMQPASPAVAAILRGEEVPAAERKKEGRTPLAAAKRQAARLSEAIRRTLDVTVVPAGSLRRESPHIGDIDLIVVGASGRALQQLAEGLGTIRLAGSRRIDFVPARGRVPVNLLVVTEPELPAAMLYFTGSKEFNVAMRAEAKRQGLLLNQYGLFRDERTRVPGIETEAGIFAALGLIYVPPPARVGAGAIRRMPARHRPVSRFDVLARMWHG